MAITPSRTTILLRRAPSIGTQTRIRHKIREAREARRRTLTARMTERGLTMTSISQQTGIDLSYVSRIISGARMPGLDTAMRLARVLGYRLDELADILIPDLDLVTRHLTADDNNKEKE